MNSRLARRSAALLAIALVLSGCSTKGGTTTTEAGDDGVKVGVGVTDDTISLGALTDLTKVYGPLAKTLVQGNQLYFDELNAAGGVCGRDVKMEIRDHAYDVQAAVSLYAELEPNVLGLVEFLGSPQVAALKDQVSTDKALSLVTTWSSQLLGDESLAVAGTLYPVDVINGLSYLQDQKLIAKGDTIGHVYFPGEFGEDALLGSEYFAEQQGMTVHGIMVEPSATDYTAQISELVSAGVSAIVISGGSGITSRLALGTDIAGLDVPLLSNGPGFDPALLSGDAAQVLTDRLYVTTSYEPFGGEGETAQKIAAAYEVAYPDESPTMFVNYGYATAEIYGKVLTKACEDGDLTREGVIKALRGMSDVTTGGILPPLDFTDIDAGSSTSSFISRVNADVPGGLVVEAEPFEAELAATFEP